MKVRNRILCAIVSVSMLSALLAGCGSNTPDDTSVQTEETQGAAAGGTEDEARETDGSEAGETLQETAAGENIRTNGGEVISLASLEHMDESSGSVVYYTSD
ncbi:MAG TPA: hypothetical protein DF613_09315, partial [Lachnospiraceae bacterium]|nr:hypothetical protein [Lachnospiraceae bacterium]